MPKRQTHFSPCRSYRYTLWREWEGKNDDYVMFIGLNPSTADETFNDPTIRRCIGFAKNWGYGALCMTNLFAFRATKPAVMKMNPDPIGMENDEWLLKMAQEAGTLVAAWGAQGAHLRRDFEVKSLLKDLHCLGMTKGGHPKHPLYVRGDTVLQRFT